MKKNIFSTAAALVATSLVCSMVLTSCSEQKAIAPEPIVKTQTEYKTITKELERIIDNILVAQTLEDHIEFLYNGEIALTAQVTPDSLCLTLPVAEHTASTIKGDNNSWRDSHGMGFTGVINLYPQEGLTLNAHIESADPFSTIKSIHPKVTWLKGKFNLVGMATDEQSGKANTFSIPVPTGSYFMCDSTVDVRQITETKFEVVHDTTYIRNDSIITEKVYEYVDVVKDAAVFNGFGYGTIDFTYGDKSFSFRMDLDSLSILRSESEWGKATKTDENRNGFTLSDKQRGKYTIKENGIKLESVSLAKAEIPFVRLNNVFQYGTSTLNVVVSYTDKSGQPATREFQVSGSHFHELKAAKAQPEDVTPEVVVTTDHTYTVDSIRSEVKDSEGNLIGEKMRITVIRDDSVVWKVQYLTWETGLLAGTLTGTQVGDNVMIRPTDLSDEVYNKDGWDGTDRSRKGFAITGQAKQYHFSTAFPKVPGFSGAEEAVAQSNIVFGTRTCVFTDEETGWGFTIPGGEVSISIVFDEVGTDEAAKAEVNGRGMQYEYIGTHFLIIEQKVNGQRVTSQERKENLLFPKN